MMTISELLEKLQIMLYVHGDIQVGILSSDMESAEKAKQVDVVVRADRKDEGYCDEDCLGELFVFIS